MSNRVVTLTIYDDLICPNCYVAYHELSIAMRHITDELHVPVSFEVEYKPYRLICTQALPEDEKFNKLDFLQAKFGKDGFQKVVDGMAGWTKKHGIPITFNSTIAQSTRGHRLSLKAGQLHGPSKTVTLHKALFHAHISEGKDISDINVLADIAEEQKVMSRDEAVSFLESDELHDEVNKQCAEARSKGVGGIPYTIIDNKIAVQGSIMSECWIKIFKRLLCCPTTESASNVSSPTLTATVPAALEATPA